MRWTRGHHSDAEDLLGDAILLAIEAVGTRLERVENPLAWLRTIIANLGRDKLRARKKRASVADSYIERETPDTASSQEEAYVTKIDLAQLMSALRRLTRMQRDALVARGLGESYSRIAETLQTSESNARKLVQLARNEVRNRLDLPRGNLGETRIE